MYLAHYDLSENPFQINTDTRFLWLSENHKEALANLQYGVLQSNGFVVLTGAVGTGKTTLVNALLENLDDRVRVATINHPTLSPLDFLRLIAKTYDPTATADNKADLLLFFKGFLEQARSGGQNVLLIIDEAHRLSTTLLEEVRLLSNMEQRGRRLLNIIFVGQSELKAKLASPESAALRQRITLYYELQPLTAGQTVDYVQHRLRVAGATDPLFTPEALQAIHRLTRGYPRAINILCDRALLTGYVKDRNDIDAPQITECMAEMRIHPTKPLHAAGRKAIWIAKAAAVRRGVTMVTGRLAEALASAAASIRQGAGVFGRRLLAAPRRGVMPIALAGVFGVVALVIVLATDSDPLPTKVGSTPAQPPAVQSTTAPVKPTTRTAAPPRRANTGAETPRPPAQAAVPDPIAVAEAALTAGQYQSAIDQLETALQDPAAPPRARRMYARALLARAEQIMASSPDEALALLEKAVAADPDNDTAHFELGRYHSRREAYPRAIAAYRTALRINPGRTEAYFNLGFLYATTGSYDTAEEMFGHVVRMQPDYLDKALFNLAMVQHRRGKTDQSIANLEQALTLRPNDPKLQAYLERFRENPAN